MEHIQVYDIAIVPLIIALVAVFIQLGLPKKLAPTIALLLGIAVGVLYVAPADPKQGVIIGLALGIAAVGLHSGTKNTLDKEKQE